MAWRAWLPDKQLGIRPALAIGVLAAAGATGLRLVVTPLLGGALPFISYFPLLLVGSLWGGKLGGFFALALSVLSAGILFFAPEDPLLPWALGSFAFSGGFLVLVGAAMADTVRALRATQARERAATAELQTLVGELGHRGRNAIAVFSALVTQSLRSAGSLEEGERIIAARFDALARAQDEVVKAGGGATLVSSLVPRTLEPFDLARFEIDLRSEGAIAAEAATALALILHELATNAVKYGALSTNGHVQISCLDTATSAVIRWQELGGPPVLAPSATGFGERLLKVGLHSHGGRAERRFEETGVVCELELPHAAAAV